MQFILDEVHAMQKEWETEGTDWAEAGIINSSKVLVVTVSAVGRLLISVCFVEIYAHNGFRALNMQYCS